MNKPQIMTELTIVYNDLLNYDEWMTGHCFGADGEQFEAMAKTLRGVMNALMTHELDKVPNTIFEDLECFGLKPELPQLRMALQILKYPENITNDGLIAFLKVIHSKLETRHIDSLGIPVMSLVEREELLQEQLDLVKDQIWFMANHIKRKLFTLPEEV